MQHGVGGHQVVHVPVVWMRGSVVKNRKGLGKITGYWLVVYLWIWTCFKVIYGREQVLFMSIYIYARIVILSSCYGGIMRCILERASISMWHVMLCGQGRQVMSK